MRIIVERTAVGEDGRVSTELVTRRADLELTAARVAGQGILWQRLLVEPLVLAVALGHPLARRDAVSLSEVAGEPFVLRAPPSGMRRQTLELCAAAGFVPAVAMEAEDLPTIRGFVAAGVGVAVVPAQGLPVPTTFARTRLVPLTDPEAHREVGLAWLEGRPLLPSAETFRHHVLASGQP